MPSHLLRRGFLGLLAAQFFGAMNDNVLKGVLTFMVIQGGLWAGDLGEGGQGIVGICFTLPFIFLSGYAGQIADRYSKRTVTMWVKIIEIPIVILAGIGFMMGSLWVTLMALLALTCQSSFFGPAKYGMIPELVDASDLSRANGTINMMTNVAVIVGTLVAGVVSDAFFPDQIRGLIWLPMVVLVLIAIAGLVSAFFLTPLPAGDRNAKFDFNPLTTYITTVREMSKTRLLMVMMAWGYFYLLAGIALFIVPEYTEVLKISSTEASVLMGVLGVSIGVGCAVAGLLSGHHIEPRLIPIGAAGLVVFFALLSFVPPSLPDLQPMLRVAFSNVGFFIFGAGFFAGFYIVPLQALLQYMSPDSERGRFLGTANAVSFVFLTVAALLYWAIRPAFGDTPQHIFLLSSILMAAGAAFFLWQLRGTGILIGSGTDIAASE
ncbi:MFS transporter [Novipirellula galeiformis]|nr:MFS transporter [Novipirellula galeiformis]